MPIYTQSRSRVIKFIFITIFVIITAQLFNLQIVSNKYQRLADDNAIYKKKIYPNRGIIFDKNGRAILDNAIMYDLMVTPAQVKNIDTAYICQLLHIDTVAFRKRMLEAIIKNTKYRPSIFEPLLSSELYARLDENLYRLPGFDLLERPIRIYPYKNAAHILGYIGEADSNIIKRSNYFYEIGDWVGRSGLEAYYESILMGQRGIQHLIRDNKNRIQGYYANGEFDVPAIAGRNLHTYLDIDLQNLLEKLLQNKIGSAVAIDPKTGGILAMASSPTYDPNVLAGPNARRYYAHLQMDTAKSMYNRATQGVYPPGSTFKPLGALVALDEGLITPSFGYNCLGRYTPCGRPACTHSGGGHAGNLTLAIANSCNSYFAHVFRLAIDNHHYKNAEEGLMKWKQYMNAFGLGHRLGIDLTGEYGGYIPDTARYNNPKFFGKNGWNSCSINSLGIGQGDMQLTPLQLANAICIIANKGFYFIPHFVKSIEGETPEDTILHKFRKPVQTVHIADNDFEAVMEGMEEVVLNGTARNARVDSVRICAKTGTVENYAIVYGRRVKQANHSVFVCFAPRENPKIAIAVIVENAGYGATWAGPIASLMIEKYLKGNIPTKRLPELEYVAHANLVPAAIKQWYVQHNYKK